MEKAKSKTDGRLNLRLTEAGKKEAVEQEKDYQRRVRRMVACLSREEQESLLKMLGPSGMLVDLDQNREEQGAIVSGDSGNGKRSASNVYHFGMRVSIALLLFKIGKRE